MFRGRDPSYVVVVSIPSVLHRQLSFGCTIVERTTWSHHRQPHNKTHLLSCAGFAQGLRMTVSGMLAQEP